MWTAITTILVPLLKWIVEASAKKKLSDKEFVSYVLAHQKRRGRAGQSAMDAEEALEEAIRELDEEQM